MSLFSGRYFSLQLLWTCLLVHNVSMSQGDSISRACGSQDVMPCFQKLPVTLPESRAVRVG